MNSPSVAENQQAIRDFANQHKLPNYPVVLDSQKCTSCRTKQAVLVGPRMICVDCWRESLETMKIVAQQPFWKEIDEYFDAMRKGECQVSTCVSIDVLKFEDLKRLRVKSEALAEGIAVIVEGLIQRHSVGELVETFAEGQEVYIVKKGLASPE